MEFLVFLVVAAALVLWGVSIYNRLVRRRTLVEEGWSGIETQLKRRSNLIPNLIETVKGYATHERATFDEITKLRSLAQADGVRAFRVSTAAELRPEWFRGARTAGVAAGCSTPVEIVRSVVAALREMQGVRVDAS